MKPKGAIRHGLTKSPSYSVWRGIKARCLNPNKKAYKNYGAKGITVCERWKSFLNFYADMGDKPEGLELDRINNSKGYSKENCHWVPGNLNAWNRGVITRHKHQLPRGVNAERPSKDGTIKYRACLSYKRLKIYLGTYCTPEEASEVYLSARKQVVAQDWKEHINDRRATELKKAKKDEKARRVSGNNKGKVGSKGKDNSLDGSKNS